jgi:hypothetical protein
MRDSLIEDTRQTNFLSVLKDTREASVKTLAKDNPSSLFILPAGISLNRRHMCLVIQTSSCKLCTLGCRVS